MFPSLVCLAVGLIGAEAGWQPLPDGGTEYIVQIEPAMLGTLQMGRDLQSPIPPELKDVRAVRVHIGLVPPPRKDLPAPAAPPRLTERPPATNFWSPQSKGAPLFPAGPGGDRSDAASLEPPRKLAPGLEDKPGPAKQAVFLEPKGDERAMPAKAAEKPASEPWLPLAVLLAGSLGGNVYLGWIAWEARRRYRAILRRGDPTEPPPERIEAQDDYDSYARFDEENR
jgi:hypothetical protein